MQTQETPYPEAVPHYQQHYDVDDSPHSSYSHLEQERYSPLAGHVRHSEEAAASDDEQHEAHSLDGRPYSEPQPFLP